MTKIKTGLLSTLFLFVFLSSVLFCFQLIDFLLQICNGTLTILNGFTLLLKRRLRHITVLLKINLADLQIIFLHHFFAGRNLALQICNSRQFFCLICRHFSFFCNGIANLLYNIPGMISFPILLFYSCTLSTSIIE